MVRKEYENYASRSMFGDGPNTERPSPVTTGARERSEKHGSHIPRTNRDAISIIPSIPRGSGYGR